MKCSPPSIANHAPLVFERPDQPEMTELFAEDGWTQWRLAVKLGMRDVWERTQPMGLDVL